MALDAHKLTADACSRALLACESHRQAEGSLQSHPLAEPGVVKNDQTSLRGWSDSNAFLHAYHEVALHQKLRPDDQLHALLFDAMEYERCMSMGAEHYRGAALNIVELQKIQGFAHNATLEAELVQQIAKLTRAMLGGLTLPGQPIRHHPAMQRLSETFLQIQEALCVAKAEQETFANLCLSILALLDTEYEMQSEAAALLADDAGAEEESKAGGAGQDSTEPSDGLSGESVMADLEEPPSLIMPHHGQDQLDLDQFQAQDDVASSSSSSGGESVAGSALAHGYRAYTTENDEVVQAADLELSQDIQAYRAQLDVFIQKHGAIVNRLSARLRQLLLAQQRSSWAFDLEEGILDTARLYRVVTTPAQALTFKAERDSLFKDTSVCLLIDNSKSMVGKPIATAAACADILAQTLERCGVAVEILGFTTTELHASESLAHWQATGAQGVPGRMNGLRHVIYKSAAVPFRRVRNNLGAMLDRQLLKQNIDGEALLWAYKRLQVQPQSRKLLMVISDGAPLDASTLTANSKAYLATHLHEVVAKIEADAAVELSAIGINHDVSHFYQNAIAIHDARDLGQALLQQLTELFKVR